MSTRTATSRGYDLVLGLETRVCALHGGGWRSIPSSANASTYRLELREGPSCLSRTPLPSELGPRDDRLQTGTS